MPYDPHPPAVKPYIPASADLPELTWRALIMGTVLGMVFGASSLYLVLKVGLTVSASIPVAVIAITLFGLAKKMGGRESTILENSITQTAGSAGESLAFGLGCTMPAIMILGFDLEISRVMLVGVLGGLLGILMMIPMRRTMIVDQHRELKYPEGTACAEVLKAAATETSRAAAGEVRDADSDEARDARRRAFIIFGGFGLGLLYKVLNISLKLWKDTVNFIFDAPLKSGSAGAEISPELLGVGYIIGPRIAMIMAGGGVLSYLLLIPMIKFFGDSLTVPVAPGTMLIRDMSPDDVRSAYVLYIGAGAVAAGGLISLVRSLPTIWNGLKGGLAGIGKASNVDTSLRTEQDMPLKWVVIGCLGIIAVITFATPLHMNVLGALLILVFGFLFSTVSSRLTGEVGSSSNPISGMAVATLLFTCLIFLVMGWTGGRYYVTALSVGAIVCIAASNAGTTSQDLKTGFLVGSTPKLQQYAILAGALASALILGPILLKLNDAGTVYVPAAQVAPHIRTDASKLTESAQLQGPQAASDHATYKVWQKTDTVGGPAGKYLVRADGSLAWLVDPGINGQYHTRPDGTEVKKFDAPKAVLMSYIIKGILDHQLPWTLVLFGVMVAVVLEMSGVASLAFTVGVYLPLVSTLPIAIGGIIRWMVDRRNSGLPQYQGLNEEELQAAGDRSSGTLLASGYIAGGALAGIIIAITAGVMTGFDDAMNKWAEAANPFFAGAGADLLSILPYAAICVLLYVVGREKARR
ncbi:MULTISPECIES: OPT family oligopeptide transporter [Massilia]|uniref:Oligopeptide transporter, OPT family n=2 Tax=Massilia TaxID=149698 RepID=A0A7X3G213_9BURK|nr:MULTISPECIES: oligopeptide transporter, OPT family [Telluria group]KQY01561.1 peptide transporter [Massilia sp. Root133]KQZ48181.1 peptide transporter [Massilia sp. Root1485]MDN4043004.1 oligopeptide transporter, OPT family [Massilia sp. YIM B02787]MVW62183.1 oligopeptide transporter, OPT family [Telluria cellulosilytica]